MATKTERGTVKRRMDDYLDTVLDKGSDSVKKQIANDQEVLTATAMKQSFGMNPAGKKPLDEYSPFAVDKRDMIFKSKGSRDAIMPTKSQM